MREIITDKHDYPGGGRKEKKCEKKNRNPGKSDH